MATENEAKLQQRTKAHAEKVYQALKDSVAEAGPRFYRDAENIFEIHDKQLWQVLGYESESAVWEDLLICRSSWCQKRRQWGEWCRWALKHEVITRKRLDRMPSQNIDQLLRLDEKRRFAPKWVEMALTMKTIDFTKNVDQVVLEPEADDDQLGSPESRAIFKVEMAKSQKQFILETMREFAREHEIPLDDEAKILELMAAEVRSGLGAEPTEAEAAAVAAGSVH